MDKNLLKAIKASTIHKKIGKNIREYIKVGMDLHEISSFIEEEIKKEVNYDLNNPLEKGIGFPVGLSLNNLAAHYTPNFEESKIFLKNTDILKIDYGIHFNGVIIDSAFTFSFNPLYEEFIQISKNVTNYAVSLCGPDVILGEIGEKIHEYVLSKEIEIEGKIYNLDVMQDLSGHKIDVFKIHAGKAVPNIKIFYPVRMKEQEFYAIEPFITTGKGKNIIKGPISHFMINNNFELNFNKYIFNKNEKVILEIIKKYYHTLPFCQKWIYQEILKLDSSYLTSLNINKILKKFIEKNILQEYPPIYDIDNSIISQFEHTIYIKENGIINLTKNDYY
jgi:methionyl aminopeptidase